MESSAGITRIMLDVDASEVTFASIGFAILILMSVMMNNLYAENLKQHMRIVRLSYNLQSAEYYTGQPYYTGISLPPMIYEPSILTIYQNVDAMRERAGADAGAGAGAGTARKRTMSM